MINNIRSGRDIQKEINELESLKIKISKLDIDDRYKLLCSEITTIVNGLNWVGEVEGYPTPSEHIKKFVYEKTRIVL